MKDNAPLVPLLDAPPLNPALSVIGGLAVSENPFNEVLSVPPVKVTNATTNPSLVA